ncbi:hypothetical protein DL96DRAFT_1820194 [Flagelloscypha sp. PMI_526]|nr:hypothetical protein DL96DRAFT_1820194 [Flagelloscypha sp. PMI_526]
MSSEGSLSLETPEDFLLFNSGLAIEASVALLSGALCYGVYIALAVISLQILGKRSQASTRPTKILYWAILFLWVIFSASVSIQAAGWMLLLRWPKLAPSTIPLKERYKSGLNAYVKLFKVTMVLHPIPYAVADAVPIWRAYVIWSNSRKTKVILITVCASNIAVCFARSILEYLAVKVHSLDNISPFLYPAQLAVSAITNGVVTIAIGIRAWRHRELTKDLRRASSNPVYILLILVEAGALLCLTQILNLTMAIMGFLLGYNSTSPYRLAGAVISIFGDTVIAAYPSLTVIVLSFRGSMLESPTNLLPGTLYHGEGDIPEINQVGEVRLMASQFALAGPSLASTGLLVNEGLRKEET